LKVLTKKLIVLFLLTFLTLYQATSTGKIIFFPNVSHEYTQHSPKKGYTEEVRYVSTHRKRTSSLVNIYIVLPIIFLGFMLTSLLKSNKKLYNLHICLDARKKLKEFILMYFNCSNYKGGVPSLLLN
jgi:hypothetical protein